MSELERLEAEKKTIERKIKALKRKERYTDAAGYDFFNNGYFCVCVRKRYLEKDGSHSWRSERNMKILEGCGVDKRIIVKELNDIIGDLLKVANSISDEVDEDEEVVADIEEPDIEEGLLVDDDRLMTGYEDD